MNEIGNNLKRTRLLKDLSLKQAGDLLNMSATAISKYEKGLIIPDSKKIIEFANAYNVTTVELLKIYNKPSLNFSSFRKKKTLTGENLNLLKDVVENNIANYLEVIELMDFNQNHLEFKKYSCTNINEIENIVDNFRKKINISDIQPISDLTSLLENLGIIIIEIKNINHKFNGFDGFSEIINNIPVITILEDQLDGARQRFTIAHELGHLLLNIKESDEEKICNKFASALLMPKQAVINEFGSKRKNISLFEITSFVKEYKISYTATTNRLKELNIISEFIYKKLQKEIHDKIKISTITPEKSCEFKRLVHKLESSDFITFNKACELLGETTDEYNEENNNY